MLTFSKPIVLAAFAALSLPVVFQAGTATAGEAHWSRADSQSQDEDNDHRRLKVALWGDEFYADDPAVKAAQIDQTISSMNAHDVDFTIFAGDTKNGHSECTDQAVGQDVIDIFNSLDAPTLYTLGDNEWTDCHRTNNGSYDPLERLAYLRTLFFDKDTTQGPDPIKVERQGKLGQAYSENSRFVMDNVEYVALDVIDNSWVEMTVDPNTENVFGFKQVFLK